MSDLRDIAVKYAHRLSAPDYSKLLNLANEIEELRSYLSEEREKNEKQVRMTMDAHAEIERLRKDRLCRCADEVRCEMRAEIERLEAALHFYADDHKYPNDGPWGINSDDFGKTAREALEDGDDDS